MGRDDKLFDEICMNIYRELYRLAQPSVDFDELVATGEAKKDNFFRNYTINDTLLHEVIDWHLKNNKLILSKREKEKVRTTVLLGCSPRSVYEQEKKETLLEVGFG